jgi:transcriptional regulator with XRE-family HTH domain
MGRLQIAPGDVKRLRVSDRTRQELADALRRCRERKGLAQKELARICGITQTTISEIENGKANPTLEVMQRLAEALGVPVLGLLGGEAVVGSLGSLLAPPVVGSLVAALLGKAQHGGYEAWVASKLVEALTEGSDRKP